LNSVPGFHCESIQGRLEAGLPIRSALARINRQTNPRLGAIASFRSGGKSQKLCGTHRLKKQWVGLRRRMMKLINDGHAKA
jgi:hypothetical protein